MRPSDFPSVGIIEATFDVSTSESTVLVSESEEQELNNKQHKHNISKRIMFSFLTRQKSHNKIKSRIGLSEYKRYNKLKADRTCQLGHYILHDKIPVKSHKKLKNFHLKS